MKKSNPIFLVLFSMSLAACGNVDSAEQMDTSDLSPEIVSPHQGSGHRPSDSALPPGAVSLNYSLSFNYAQIRWSASYVASAFLRVPTNYRFADPISFSQFAGEANDPYAFAPLSNESELLGNLAGSPFAAGVGSLPINYCKIPRAGIQGISSEECYASNPNTRPYNYIDVMIPRTGTHSHVGLLKFRLPAKKNVFTVYYRDWANRLHKTQIKVARPG
ncbi:hypothetical protein FBR05_01345 [Deltaproteobacteria bacterium PRO3]|nr:hypothetical protein [Deltaproteobacteria bacterium PRO3]